MGMEQIWPGMLNIYKLVISNSLYLSLLLIFANLYSLVWEILLTETYPVKFLLPAVDQEMLLVVGGIHC